MAKKKKDDFLSSFVTKNAPQVTQGKSVVKHDRWDEEDANRLLEEMREFNAAEDRLSDFVSTGSHAFLDMFYALVKADPKLADKKVVRPSYLINRAVMDEAMALKEYEEMRLFTAGDEIGAAMADVTMEPELETLFDKLRKESELADAYEKMLQQMGALDQEIRTAEQMMNDLLENGDPNKEAENWQDRVGALQEQMDALAQQVQAAGEELENSLDGKSGQIRASMKAAFNTALGEAEQMDQLSTAWGLDPGTLTRMPPEQRLELARKLNNEKFRRIASLFGPMHRLAFAEQMRKTIHSRDEIYDVEIGNDLSRILPMELLSIRHPVLKRDFFRRFYEGQLLQYELRGEERLAKGAIIVCEDGSGSMAGEREIWAKAVGLTLLQIAKSQDRSFYGIHFGGPGMTRQFDFRDPRNVTIEGVIDYASTFFNGGTDFMTPLSQALDLLKAEHLAKGHVNGDIVFITDGQCGISDKWLEEFKLEQDRIGFRVYGVIIDGHPDSEPLKSICDGRVLTIANFTDGSDLREIFRAL